MTGCRLRAALLIAAAVPLAAATAAAVLKAGHWRLHADRHRIELTPQPRRSCPDCRDAGGWGSTARTRRWRRAAAGRTGANCASALPVPAWPDNELPL
ncbi:hypothetical protein [Streptomyces sp. AGS-58]|uniref:hypothetical protein n=1 Tax=unclassified Streptomyces TaxID=2593676 RepID=UPI0035A305D8